MRSGGTRVRGSGVSQQVTNPVGDSNPCPRIGTIGDRQGRDARTGPRQEGPQTANSRRDSYCWGYRPKLPGEALAVVGPLKRSDSKLARRGPGPNRSLATPLAGEHERKRLRPKTVELSPGSTPWRHGDLRRLLFDRGMLRADGSTTCPPDGVMMAC